MVEFGLFLGAIVGVLSWKAGGLAYRRWAKQKEGS
jgi:hypothetical protein